MPSKKLKNFLDTNNIKYAIIKHSPAYTALEVAESTHISGKNIAKTVIVKIDGKLAMVVVPSTEQVDIDAVKNACGANLVEISTEQEFKSEFPDCELGALPPFGNLYNMDVYVTPSLTEDKKIAFSAGTHSEVFQLAYDVYDDLVKPKVIQ